MMGFARTLNGATNDWLGQDICLSGLGYAPETDDNGVITRIALKQNGVCLAQYNGVTGLFSDATTNTTITDLEDVESKPREDLKLQLGYHAVVAAQTPETQVSNLFYYEQRIRLWYVFFPVEESSISFLDLFARDHEIDFPDPDADDPAKILIDGGVYEASKRKNINYLIKVLKEDLNEKVPLEKELYLSYLNRCLEKERVCLEKAYACRTYFMHVDGGYEECSDDGTAQLIMPTSDVPLRFTLLGADDDPGDREIALSLITKDYDVLLPVSAIMNCKLTTAKQ